MARYNEILVGRFARGVQKLFGVKGEVPVASLAGEISIGHVLSSGRENRYLEGWRTFGGSVQTNAVAAQDDVIRLANPPGSNIIAVIESISFFFSAAGELFLEFSANSGNAALTTTLTPTAFDARDNPPASGSNGAACSLSWQNNIGQSNHVVFGHYITAAGVTSNEVINYDQQEIPMLAGGDLQFRSVTLNLQMTVNLRWRERFLEEQERT